MLGTWRMRSLLYEHANDSEGDQNENEPDAWDNVVIVLATAKGCDYLALHGGDWLWRAERVEPHTLPSFGLMSL